MKKTLEKADAWAWKNMPLIAVVTVMSWVGIFLAYNAKGRVSAQSEADLQRMSKAIWEKNGYQVTGFKGVQRELGGSFIKASLKQNASGKAYEGTVKCVINECKISKTKAL